MNNTNLEIKVTPTRNEHSVTFTLNRELLPYGKSLSFSNPASAAGHPMASAILSIKGILSVWIMGPDLLVTKGDEVRWPTVKSKVIEAIQATHQLV